MTFWIPKGNPDFEDKLGEVHYFWLEINDTGQVTREIGFSQSGEPLTAAPLGENLGVFTDEERAPELLEASVNPNEFESIFLKFRTPKDKS
jgi:hypothetical protein